MSICHGVLGVGGADTFIASLLDRRDSDELDGEKVPRIMDEEDLLGFDLNNIFEGQKSSLKKKKTDQDDSSIREH